MKSLQKITNSQGFTLVEIMMVVAIVVILAGVAWPLYQSQSRKNYRTEAISDLSKIQTFMNRCYADNGGYECCDNATMDAFTAANPPPMPPARRYTLTFAIRNVDGGAFACKQAQGYTVTAAPIPGTDQANDTKCASFTIDELGNRTALDGGGVAQPTCWTD
ncbi:MAG: type IV pilin protein [Thioalkalispiraceae bacterium]